MSNTDLATHEISMYRRQQHLDDLMNAYARAVHAESQLPVPNDANMAREELVALLAAKGSAKRAVASAAIALADAYTRDRHNPNGSAPELEGVTLAWCHDLTDPDGGSTPLCEYLFNSRGAYAGVRWFCDPRELAQCDFDAEVFATLSLSLGLVIAEAREEGMADIYGLLRHTLGPYSSLYASVADGPIAQAIIGTFRE